MKNIIISREVLAIYDSYDQDFGLMHERWASEKDRRSVTSEQCALLGEYVQSLQVMKRAAYSDELKRSALQRIDEIEEVMDREVSAILRERALRP